MIDPRALLEQLSFVLLPLSLLLIVQDEDLKGHSVAFCSSRPV